MNNLYFDPKKLNFDPKEIPLNPIQEQYQYDANVRGKVYLMYRNMCEFNLTIKDIHITKCEERNYYGWKWHEVTVSITSNSIMDPYNLATEVVKLPSIINF